MEILRRCDGGGEDDGGDGDASQKHWQNYVGGAATASLSIVKREEGVPQNCPETSPQTPNTRTFWDLVPMPGRSGGFRWEEELPS